MKRVLIVDDDEALRQVLRIGVESQGWEAAEAASAQEAITVAGGGRFDAVSIDLSLGHEDGMSLIREMRQVQPEAAIYVLTGKNLTDKEQNEALDLGADGCLMKIQPFKSIIKGITRSRSRK